MKGLNKRQRSIWGKWEIIQKEKAMDHRGDIPCEICKREFNYDEISLGVYYRKQFPLYMVAENNYFVCANCRPNKDKKSYISKQLAKLPEISYSRADMQMAEQRLDRIIKNFSWQKIKTQE